MQVKIEICRKTVTNYFPLIKCMYLLAVLATCCNIVFGISGSNTSAVIKAMETQTRVVKELIEKVVAASQAQTQTMRNGFELVANKLADVVREAVDHRTPEDMDLQAIKPDPKLETCFKSDYYFDENSDEELFFGDIEALEEHVEVGNNSDLVVLRKPS